MTLHIDEIMQYIIISNIAYNNICFTYKCGIPVVFLYILFPEAPWLKKIKMKTIICTMFVARSYIAQLVAVYSYHYH